MIEVVRQLLAWYLAIEFAWWGWLIVVWIELQVLLVLANYRFWNLVEPRSGP